MASASLFLPLTGKGSSHAKNSSINGFIVFCRSLYLSSAVQFFSSPSS